MWMYNRCTIHQVDAHIYLVCVSHMLNYFLLKLYTYLVDIHMYTQNCFQNFLKLSNTIF